ncbi:MAG: C69 family dipeptidase [Breznakibacter sp.]
MNKRILLSLLAPLSIWGSMQHQATACTNVLVTRGASVDGSTIISYSADSHVLYGELYHWPAATYPDGTMLDIHEWDTGKYLGKIKQAKQTYSVIGNINEFQVTIAETTFGGRDELVDTTGIMDYGSLIYVALQRSRTAREAVKVMTSLVEEYGYYSGGESFSIGDPNEVWVMEMVGKGPGRKGANWVAVKIPDGMVSAHANQARITTFPLKDSENCLYSKDVINFAREMKYFDGKDKDFSFSDAYAPLTFDALRFCEARVWSAFRLMNPAMDKYADYAKGVPNAPRMPLYMQPSKKVSVRDVQDIMRDHYEGTDLDMTKDPGAGPFHVPYRYRPLTWKVGDAEYFNERAIATQQTGFVFVSQMRNWLDNPIGGVFWFGVDDADMTVFMPVYCGITSIPPSLKVGNGDMLTFTWDAAFWVFNWVANQAYGRYSLMIEDIRKAQKSYEDKFALNQPAIEQAAKSLYNQNPDLARQFLTEYTTAQVEQTIDGWRKLGQFLFVKYLDGNLHPEKDGQFLRNAHGQPANAKYPGYSPDFYEKVVKDTGDRLKVPAEPEKK